MTPSALLINWKDIRPLSNSWACFTFAKKQFRVTGIEGLPKLKHFWNFPTDSNEQDFKWKFILSTSYFEKRVLKNPWNFKFPTEKVFVKLQNRKLIKVENSLMKQMVASHGVGSELSPELSFIQPNPCTCFSSYLLVTQEKVLPNHKERTV